MGSFNSSWTALGSEDMPEEARYDCMELTSTFKPYEWKSVSKGLRAEVDEVEWWHSDNLSLNHRVKCRGEEITSLQGQTSQMLLA